MITNNVKSIATGDLLVWDKPNGDNKAFWLNLVRLATVSNYGHISVAVVKDDGLYHVEAVIPAIKESKIKPGSEFYVLPMSKVIDEQGDLEFFKDKLGKPYSVMDAIRGYLGMTVESNDHWQCAELCQEYYQAKGIDINLRFLTPTRLVKALMRKTGLGLYQVNY